MSSYPLPPVSPTDLYAVPGGGIIVERTGGRFELRIDPYALPPIPIDRGPPGADGKDGKDGIGFRTPVVWTPNTAYSAAVPAHSVTYDGSLWLCTTSHTSGSTFAAGNWLLLASKGQDGEDGSSPGGDYLSKQGGEVTGAITAPTPSRTDPAAATDPKGTVITAPYLLGLRNKTINVRRYTSINGAVADLGDNFTLDVPAGDFLVQGTAGLVMTDKSISVRGEGSNVSRIYVPNGGQGLVMSVGTNFRNMKVEGLALLSQGNAGTALSISRPVDPGNILEGPRVSDVVIRGADPINHGWALGIDLYYASNCYIDKLQYQGKNGQTTSTGVRIRGQSTPVTLTNANIIWANNAVWCTPGSFSEGFISNESQIVACNIGYLFEDPDNANQPGLECPLMEIRGGHTNTYVRGLAAVRRNSVKISGHTFYKREESNDNYIAVLLTNACHHSSITDNNFFGFKGARGGTATGVQTAGSIGVSVVGNAFVDFDTALGPVDTALYARSNRARNVTTWAAGSPTGSQIEAPFTY